MLPDVVQIGLDIDRPRLHERIAARVDAMWAAGLVDEVRQLAAHGLRDGLTASRALGYRQVLAFLDGEITEEEAYAADRHGHPPLRPAPGLLVSPGPADPLARPRSTGSGPPGQRVARRIAPGARLRPVRRWSFSKGHGTQNDFVLLLDREAMLDVGPAEVRYLCDRHAGLGADGLLRAVAAKHIKGWDGDGSLWFMDYRNADGSVAEMCGNGVRVFVRFLLDAGLATGPTVDVATRAGLRQAIVLPDGRIRVAMGPVTVGPARVQVNTVDGVPARCGDRRCGEPARGELRR